MRLNNDKYPGDDNIPAELLKQSGSEGIIGCTEPRILVNFRWLLSHKSRHILMWNDEMKLMVTSAFCKNQRFLRKSSKTMIFTDFFWTA